MGFFFRFFLRSILYSILAWGIFSTIDHLDLSKVVHSHAPGDCHRIIGIEHGSEDLDVLPNGKAIFSTNVQISRKLSKPSDPDPAMMVYDITNPDQRAKILKITGFKGNLNLHGLSLFVANGNTYVYVINHPPFFEESETGDVVLKFLWNVDKDELVHQKTFSDYEFVGLNDLVVVGEDQFYISNMEGMRNKFLKSLETYLWFLPQQNVVYYDGTKGTIVLPGMYGANGINVSPDGKFLYISEVQKRRISSYRIRTPTNLVLQDTKYLGSMPDNINIDAGTGDLWVGCHPIAYKLLKRFSDSAAESPPSQVIRIEASDGKLGQSEEIYADDGQQLSGSSAAAYHKPTDTVVMGTIAERAIVCKCQTCRV